MSRIKQIDKMFNIKTFCLLSVLEKKFKKFRRYRPRRVVPKNQHSSRLGKNKRSKLTVQWEGLFSKSQLSNNRQFTVSPQPHDTYICDIRVPCYSAIAHMYVTLAHRNSYDTHISDMLLEVCKQGIWYRTG